MDWPLGVPDSLTVGWLVRWFHGCPGGIVFRHLPQYGRHWDRILLSLIESPLVGLMVKAVLNWAEHSVHEQLCLLEMLKLAVWFLIDVFDLGKQLCSRPMGRRSDVRNVGSAGYGSMLLIGLTPSWRRRRNKKEARLQINLASLRTV